MNNIVKCNCDAIGNGFICNKPAVCWHIFGESSVIGRCNKHILEENMTGQYTMSVRHVTYEEALVWQVMNG
jgi:hypothetical protein